MSKVVIFGGGGFVGTAVCSALKKKKIKFIAPTIKELNLTDYNDAAAHVSDIVDDGDSIVMIAALTREHGEAYLLTEANISMAANVINGISKKNIAHCIYVSSDSVYGKDAPQDKILINETCSPLPDTLYGYMHIIREQMFKENISPDKLTILRPCAVYGMGDTHNAYGINQFIKDAYERGKIVLFGEGEDVRSNVHVDDVASIIAIALERRISGVFNVNCGRAWSFKEIADIIKSNITKKIRISKKLRTMPITYRNFDNSKLAGAFFEPRFAEKGIKQFIRKMDKS